MPAPVYKNPQSVLVVVHTPNMDLLLLERAGRQGYWQSVTGSLEDDESYEAAARRELKEETGIDDITLTPWRQQNRFKIMPEWRHRYAPGCDYNDERVFSALLPERRPVDLAPEEHRRFAWFPWRDAADLVFSWNNRDAILMLGLMGISAMRHEND